MEEELYHALWSCKFKEDVTSKVFTNLSTGPAQHANLSGSFFNWMTRPPEDGSQHFRRGTPPDELYEYEG